MKKIFLLSGLVFLSFSCNQKPTEQVVDQPTDNTEEVVDNHKNVQPTSVLVADIAGMSCEKGCGSSIRRELFQNGGVSKVEYADFDEEKEFNVIKVYYDEKEISEDEIILALTTMEEHKYTVENSHSEKIKE
jgi:hypothetical protein